jgi:hypothetical protein
VSLVLSGLHVGEFTVTAVGVAGMVVGGAVKVLIICASVAAIWTLFRAVLKSGTTAARTSEYGSIQYVRETFDPEPVVLTPGYMAGVSLPEDPACSIAGRAAGAEIRRAMGFPTYTRANRMCASDRIERYRKDNYPTMRYAHQEAFFYHALYWVFTPSGREIRTWETMHTIEEAETRVIPEGAYVSKTPVTIWERVKAALGLGEEQVFVGPGFQMGSQPLST